MSNVVQRSFAGGEIAPSLYARTDQAKYATGLRTCRNFMVQRHGGVTNRPGTDFVASTKQPALAARLLKFVFNADQTYVLEFGDHYIRVFRNGAPVVVGATPYEIASPYGVADLALLQYVQSGDVITLVHPDYAPRELSRLDHANWTLSLVVFGPPIGKVASVTLSGGSAGPITYWAVTTIDEKTGQEGLPFIISALNRVPSSATPVILSWPPVTGAIGYNVYRSTDGSTFGLISLTGGTPLPVVDTSWTTTFDTLSTTTKDAWVTSTGQARNPVATGSAEKAYDGKYTIKGTLQISTALTTGSPASWNPSGRVQVCYKRDAEIRVVAATIAEVDLVGLTADSTDGPFDFTYVLDVPDNGYSTLEIDLVPEGFIHVVGSGTVDLLVRVDGFEVDSSQGGVGLNDTGETPDYAVAPPSQPNLFSTTNEYPSVVSYYQQRALFANTRKDPEKVWGSRSASFKNFSKSTPLQDDDALSWSLAGRQVNDVRHLVDLGKLVAFTSAGEWTVEGGQDGILRPGEINPRQYSYNGASRLTPLVVGNTIVYVQARGTIVRDLMNDAIEGYKGNDLTIFAAHLFDGKSIVDWDFAQIPHSIIWAVRSDGVLLGLTYIKEHQVWGWHRHDTDGFVENVCVVPEGDEDRVYLVVRRVVNGATVRYVERLASRFFSDPDDAHFVDCALTYDGWNATATTMALTGGVAWDSTELLTVTRSVGGFTADEVGNAVFFVAADGSELRVALEAYTSPTVMQGRANRDVPADLRATPTAKWARAVDAVGGLEHLEGKAVSVYADGNVVASPNNSDFDVLAVTGGVVAFDTHYAVVRVGLPYVSDLETLDIDGAQGPSLKDKRVLVNRVGLFVEAARGIFVGARPPSGADPLAGLQEYKARDAEGYDAPTLPTTDAVDVNIESSWNSNGRVFVRQVDPLPLTVLAVIPQGFLPVSG